ncbi:MAG: hypothetical protein QUS11_02880 [Candidatus Fermentibacter sp.]|nr:hypothetical protein [Candidatus Fermentibacter sp.]
MRRKSGTVSAALSKKLDNLTSIHHGCPPGLLEKIREAEAVESEAAEAEAIPAGRDVLAVAKTIRPGMAAMRRDFIENRKSIIRGRRLLQPVPMGGPWSGSDTRYAEKLTAIKLSNPWRWPIPPDPPASTFRMTLRCRSGSAWNTNDLDYIHCGVAGWCDTCSGTPRLSNLNGKGTIVDNLDLVWSGTVPGSGKYLMAPGLTLLCDGFCFADGYAKPGVDASAEATIFCFLTLGDDILAESAVDIAETESHILAGTENFGGPIQLMSDLICFDAVKDQELQLLVRLEGHTWTRGRGDAEVQVDLFGLICNTWSDSEIVVGLQ